MAFMTRARAADKLRLASFSVVADPHVPGRTLRSAPPSGLAMLASRRRVVPVLAFVTLLLAAQSVYASHSIVIGVQCDASGPARAEGVPRCAGHRDYVELVNSKGGVGGHRIQIVEVDHESKMAV